MACRLSPKFVTVEEAETAIARAGGGSAPDPANAPSANGLAARHSSAALVRLQCSSLDLGVTQTGHTASQVHTCSDCCNPAHPAKRFWGLSVRSCKYCADTFRANRLSYGSVARRTVRALEHAVLRALIAPYASVLLRFNCLYV